MNRTVHTSRSHTGRRGGVHSHRSFTLRLFRVRGGGEATVPWPETTRLFRVCGGGSCLEFTFHSLRTAFPGTRGRVKLVADRLDLDVCGFV